MVIERDTAEREAREKETRVLSLTRELDELMVKVEELERGKRTLQNELDELINNQGTADKNVSLKDFYFFSSFYDKFLYNTCINCFVFLGTRTRKSQENIRVTVG